MGKGAEPGAGAIYRYYRGAVQRLFHPITISNAICFAPDRSVAYFTDTPKGIVMRQALNADDGWPEGDPEPWLDLRAEGLNPDGAVVDAEHEVLHGVLLCWASESAAAGASWSRLTSNSPVGRLTRTGGRPAVGPAASAR